MARRLGAIAIAFTLVSGCAAGGPSEEAGMVIGGVLGGILGAQVDSNGPRDIAIIAGTMAGSAIGGAIGRSMDDVDRLRAGQTLETVRSGVPASWRNPDTGVRYRFTPTRTMTRASGPCREYSLEAEIGGEIEKLYGTACRQADGHWLIQ